MGKQVFTYDISKLSAAIRKRLREVPELAHAAMNAVGARVELEAKFRCPISPPPTPIRKRRSKKSIAKHYPGTLTGGIKHAVKAVDGAIGAVIYVPSNHESSQYAVAMHEHQYHIGKASRERQAKYGVVVGRKFITRAIDDNRKAIASIITDKLKVSQWT